jgi:nicotinamide mononucleotide transporter
MSWTEALGFALALVMVFCSIREIHWSWPLAMVSSALYFFVFRDSLLYAEAGLQIVFAVLALWGWRQWLRRSDDQTPDVQIHRMTARGWWWSTLAFATLWPVLALGLLHYTDSDVPWWDALPTALSLIGQALLGRKFIENWLVWFVVNTISMGLFAYKGLWLTCLLYLIFTVMSVAGWRAWQKRLQAA